MNTNRQDIETIINGYDLTKNEREVRDLAYRLIEATTITADMRAKAAGLHFAKEMLSPIERDMLRVIERVVNERS